MGMVLIFIRVPVPPAKINAAFIKNTLFITK